MDYSPKEVNEAYWCELTKKASEKYKKTMRRMDSCEDFVRDDSFHGHEAPNHMMYKLETLYSKDGHRAYEFLVEYDKWEPTVGIYYGCKGLILDGDTDEEKTRFDSEWKEIKEELTFILNNVFTTIDFTPRFKPTNNLNNATYWPFWVTLNENEDIIKVAARATRIIREVYKRYHYCPRKAVNNLESDIL